MYICKDVLIEKSGCSRQTFHKVLTENNLPIRQCYSKQELLILVCKLEKDNIKHIKRYDFIQAIKGCINE